VADFGYIETKTEAGVPVRVYAPKGMEKDGKFSLDLAAKTLDFFGKEFGSPYPLPKMDMVLVPFPKVDRTDDRSLFPTSPQAQWR
jgi:aminopeptidase 2